MVVRLTSFVSRVLNGAEGQRTKVAKYCLGVVGGVHEGGAAEERGKSQSGDGHAALVGPLENPGRMALLCETEQSTGSNVQIRVGGAESEEENACVENVRECLDASDLDGDNERRGRGRGRFAGRLDGKRELVRVVGNEHAQEEHGEAVEEEDSVEGEFDGAGNRLAGVLGLADSNTNQLRAEVGEDGVDEGAPEAVEFACGARVDIRPEGSGVLVVLEASCVAGTSANCEQEREENHADLKMLVEIINFNIYNTHNDDHLERTQPELQLTKELDSAVVDGADDEEEDQNPDARIDFFWRFPLLNNQGRCSELVGRGDDVLAPVGPSEGKTKSRVAEAGSVASETRRVGDPSSHLAQRRHDDVDEETDRRVCDEDRAGTAGVSGVVRYSRGAATHPD